MNVSLPSLSAPPSSKALAVEIPSLWMKICHIFHEVMERVKHFFTSAWTTPLSILPKNPIVLPPLDTSYLQVNDPSYNLERLSEIRVENSIQSVSTEAAWKSLPKKNPIHLGYEDPVDYQTMLGDRAIGALASLSALAIIGVSRGALFFCEKNQDNNPLTFNEAPYEICRRRVANLWQNSPGNLFLAGSALLLALSIYAHNKGWLGALLHDPHLGWRQRQIEALFRSAANELEVQAKTDPEKAEKMAEKILHNVPLIETTLAIELQLPSENAKGIVDILKKSCKEILENREFASIWETKA